MLFLLFFNILTLCFSYKHNNYQNDYNYNTPARDCNCDTSTRTVYYAKFNYTGPATIADGSGSAESANVIQSVYDKKDETNET